MNRQELLDKAFSEWDARDAPWYKKLALDAIKRDQWWLIVGRNDKNGYMGRFWATTARVKEGPARWDCPWDVENSVVIHLFLRPDDDAALHDHPCPFKTTILSGWYDEARPPEDWVPGSELGPAPKLNVKRRHAGSTLIRQAADLHAVVGLPTDQETWTIVDMGARERNWGFHPESGLWQPAHQYIKDHP